MNQRPRIKLPRWKKAVYGCLATVAFCFIIEVLLFALRVDPLITNEDPFVGFEARTALFVRDEQADGSQRTTARNRLAYFNAQRFSANKAPRTFRIFCLGGSTTYGRPYNDHTSYVGWLRELLPLADDRRQYEVINAGGISYASYRVASLMDELCGYEPDLFVVYMGHNEFLEQRTYQDLLAMSQSQRNIRWALGHSRSYSLLHSWVYTHRAGDVRTILPSEVDTILDHSVGPDAYERSMLQRPQVIHHFAFNLARIIDRAHAVNAQVIIVSPAANLKDFSPFKSQHRSGLTARQHLNWNTLFDAGMDYRSKGEREQAMESFRAAEIIDDQFAELHYRIGQTLYDSAEWRESSIAFRRAVDEDVCPLRATTAIRQLVERTAVLRKVPLVDFPAILDERNHDEFRQSVVGRELFLDHVHPTLAANRLLAFSLIEVLRKLGTLPPSNPKWVPAEIEQVVWRVEEKVDIESQTVSLRNLAQVLGWAGKHAEAGPLALQAVQLREAAQLPDDPEALFYAAIYQATRGKNLSAIRQLERMIKQRPNHHQARWRLAFLYFEQEDYARASDHYRRALQSGDLNDESRCHFGTALTRLGKFMEAMEVLLVVADRSPGFEALLALGEAFEGCGEINLAVDAYQNASDRRPAAITPRHLLARLLTRRGDRSQAAKWYRTILEIDPNLRHIQDELDAVESQPHR